jgi:hypothetical protein
MQNSTCNVCRSGTFRRQLLRRAERRGETAQLSCGAARATSAAGVVLAIIDNTVNARRPEEVLRKSRDCRSEIGIVRTALDDLRSLHEPPIPPIQIEPRLNRDRAMDTECLIVHVRGYKATHFSPGIWLQRKAPLYAVGCGGIASCSRLETPVARLSFSHMECEIAAQLCCALKSGYPARSLDC